MTARAKELAKRAAKAAAKKKSLKAKPAAGGKGGGNGKKPPSKAKKTKPPVVKKQAPEKGPKAQVQGAVEKKLDRRSSEKVKAKQTKKAAKSKTASAREKFEGKLGEMAAGMRQNKQTGFFKQPKAEAGARAERMMRGRRLQGQKQMQKAYEANMKKLLDPSSGLYKDKTLAAELNKMRQRSKIDRGFEAGLRKKMKAKADKFDAAEKRMLAIAANPGKRKK